MSEIVAGLAISFGLSMVISVLFLASTLRLERSDVQFGLQLLIVISIIWSASELITLVSEDVRILRFAYYISLSTGLSTVMAWMYFASAYADREYHEGSVIGYIGLIVYLIVLIIKTTNPIHDLYFSMSLSETSLTYMTIEYGVLHSFVTFLSYLVISYGLYLFYTGLQERRVSYSSIVALVGSILVPAVISVAIRLDQILPSLSGLSIDSIGVSIFVIATVAVTSNSNAEFYKESRDSFISSIPSPSVIVDLESHQVLLYNEDFEKTFLHSGILDENTQTIQQDVLHDNEIIELDDRIYSTSVFTHSYSKSADSKIIVFNDITEEKSMSDTIASQADHIDSLSKGISHEMRNMSQLIESKAVLSRSDRREVDLGSDLSGLSDRISRVGDDLRIISDIQMTDKEELETHRISDLIISSIGKRDDIDCSVKEDSEEYRKTDKHIFSIMIDRILDIIALQGGKYATFKVGEDALIINTDAERLETGKLEGLSELGHSSPCPKLGSTPPVIYKICDLHDWKIEIDSKDGNLLIKIHLSVTTENPKDT